MQDRMQRFSIGLTGGIGSGKSTIADRFGALGAAIIDTDVIAHALTASNGLAIAHIRESFGAEFIDQNGALDRARMRAAVFNDAACKRKLEEILHPLIREETTRAAQEANGSYLMFVVPLLVESGTWKQRVSRVLVVDCSEDTQIRRVMQRNGFSEEQVRAIMATQVSRTVRLEAADDVILNDGESGIPEAEIVRLHAQYMQLAAKYPAA